MKIDGKQIAQTILADLANRVNKLKTRGIIPHLVIILVGDDPASKAYVHQKELKGNEIGAKITIKHLPPTITQEQLLKTIKDLNNDHTVHGIIVQQPLPFDINIPTITQAVEPRKDVDGFHPDTNFPMPLPEAVVKILESVEKDLQDKKIVVIGKGETGGGPVIQKFRAMGIKPEIIDSKTTDPDKIARNADILISAVGKANVVMPSMIKKGVVLVSVGLHKGKDGKLHGDYNEEEVESIASFYTPTPGGVGPVNVAMLLENLIKASEK